MTNPLRTIAYRRKYLSIATAAVCVILVGCGQRKAAAVDCRRDVGSYVAAGPDLTGPDLNGRWRVIDVLIDTGATRRQAFEMGDPSEVGKSIIFDTDKVTGNVPETIDCLKPRYERSPMPLAKILADTLSARNYPAVAPKVTDYLPEGEAQDAVVLISCKSGSVGFGADDGPHPLTMGVTWTVLLKNGDMALQWYDSSLLILRRE